MRKHWILADITETSPKSLMNPDSLIEGIHIIGGMQRSKKVLGNPVRNRICCYFSIKMRQSFNHDPSTALGL